MGGGLWDGMWLCLVQGAASRESSSWAPGSGTEPIGTMPIGMMLCPTILESGGCKERVMGSPAS